MRYTTCAYYVISEPNSNSFGPAEVMHCQQINPSDPELENTHDFLSMTKK